MILLDTHAVVWLAQSPDLLSGKARDAIRDARVHSGLAISDKTLWEIAMMVSRGKLEAKISVEDFLQAVEKNLRVVPINSAIASRSVQFSSQFPKDPADRLIAATALTLGVPLLTADQAIRSSGEVPCIW